MIGHILIFFIKLNLLIASRHLILNKKEFCFFNFFFKLIFFVYLFLLSYSDINKLIKCSLTVSFLIF
jgi:hypothetical protein